MGGWVGRWLIFSSSSSLLFSSLVLQPTHPPKHPYLGLVIKEGVVRLVQPSKIRPVVRGVLVGPQLLFLCLEQRVYLALGRPSGLFFRVCGWRKEERGGRGGGGGGGGEEGAGREGSHQGGKGRTTTEQLRITPTSALLLDASSSSSSFSSSFSSSSSFSCCFAPLAPAFVRAVLDLLPHVCPLGTPVGGWMSTGSSGPRLPCTQGLPGEWTAANHAVLGGEVALFLALGQLVLPVLVLLASSSSSPAGSRHNRGRPGDGRDVQGW